MMPESVQEGRITEPDGRKLVLGDQKFDLALDFFLCPSHGLIVPSKFDEEWNTERGCPVPTYHEERCDEPLTAVFLNTLEARLLSDRVIEAVAREQWQRTRIRDSDHIGAVTDLPDWDHLTTDDWAQKMHEAEQDLRAVFAALQVDEETTR